MKTIKITLLVFGLCVMYQFANAQSCPGNKVRVYRCNISGTNCASKCVNSNNITPLWYSTCRTCSGGNPPRLAIEQSVDDLFSLTISPNPVSNSTTISFIFEQSQNVSLEIFDLNGRLIETLADNVFEKGEHQIEFNAEKLDVGIYFLKMQTGDFLKTEKLIVTK